jgi:hypothetical protein
LATHCDTYSIRYLRYLLNRLVILIINVDENVKKLCKILLNLLF